MAGHLNAVLRELVRLTAEVSGGDPSCAELAATDEGIGAQLHQALLAFHTTHTAVKQWEANAKRDAVKKMSLAPLLSKLEGNTGMASVAGRIEQEITDLSQRVEALKRQLAHAHDTCVKLHQENASLQRQLCVMAQAAGRHGISSAAGTGTGRAPCTLLTVHTASSKQLVTQVQELEQSNASLYEQNQLLLHRALTAEQHCCASAERLKRTLQRFSRDTAGASSSSSSSSSSQGQEQDMSPEGQVGDQQHVQQQGSAPRAAPMAQQQDEEGRGDTRQEQEQGKEQQGQRQVPHEHQEQQQEQEQQTEQVQEQSQDQKQEQQQDQKQEQQQQTRTQKEQQQEQQSSSSSSSSKGMLVSSKNYLHSFTTELQELCTELSHAVQTDLGAAQHRLQLNQLTARQALAQAGAGAGQGCEEGSVEQVVGELVAQLSVEQVCRSALEVKVGGGEGAVTDKCTAWRGPAGCGCRARLCMQPMGASQPPQRLVLWVHHCSFSCPHFSHVRLINSCYS
jgi:hypothetical protein